MKKLSHNCPMQRDQYCFIDDEDCRTDEDDGPIEIKVDSHSIRWLKGYAKKLKKSGAYGSVTLMGIQHELAKRLGYACWADLRLASNGDLHDMIEKIKSEDVLKAT